MFFDPFAIQYVNTVIVDKINELDHQRVSLEEQSQSLKKIEEEQEKEQRKLSFYASVTKIIPNLENRSKIAGQYATLCLVILHYCYTLTCYPDIVERDKKAVENFEFDPSQEDAFDICNNTWKMINL
ncbi:Kinetochore protein SPC24-like protein [Bienertia sinuspersici]